VLAGQGAGGVGRSWDRPLTREGGKFTSARTDARECDSPMEAQTSERHFVITIVKSGLRLQPDRHDAGDFADEAVTQFVCAHRRARDFRCAIILLRKGLIGDICLNVNAA
jgi:hypothetical protein